MKSEHTPKLCECGCGQPTTISPYSFARKGYVKGQGRRFITGHNGAHRPLTPLSERYVVEDRGFATPCWVWTMATDVKGYAEMWDNVKQKVVRAHRFFYEHFKAPIPEGMQIDHLCRVRSCVNPHHLEVVTNAENQRRGWIAREARMFRRTPR